MRNTDSASAGGPSVFHTARRDVGRVRTGIQESGWARTVTRTFDDLQAFYLLEEQRRSLRGMSRVGRWLHLVWWLLKGLFFKLTPARRVLLAIALFYLLSSREGFSVGDHVRVGVNVPLIGATLLLLLLMLELKDKLLARHELEAGRAVQTALMPAESPAIPGWEVWLFTRPANDVGGDLVDCIPLDAVRHGLTLADVAGKALPAALLMAKVQSTLRALATEFASLCDLGARVNRILCRDGLPDRFVTMVYLEVGDHANRVRVLNAGHMPPFVLRQHAEDVMPRGDMAMGLLAGATFNEQTVDLEGGDMLVVYSAGVTEAMNAAGDFFGDDRLQALLPGLHALTPQDAGRRILGAVDAFVGDARPHDDVSLIVLKRGA
jgi:sigma-B regulation protein RsbU (phosphoserine phosphatase)